MPHKCSIKGCDHNISPQDRGHRLPANKNKRNEWFAVFALNGIRLRSYKKQLICECHFNEDQYSLAINQNRFLKADAIPVKFYSVNNNIKSNAKNQELIALRKMKIQYEYLTSGLLKFFTENQISHIISGDPDLEFDNQTIIKSLEILEETNERTYEFLYNLGYPLPSYMTLQQRIQTLNLNSKESQQMITNQKKLMEEKSETHQRVSQQMLSINPNLIIFNKNSDNNNQNIKISKVIKIRVEKQINNNIVNNNNNFTNCNTQNPKNNYINLKCNECNLIFENKHKLSLHKTAYHSVKGYKFICDTNGCGFSTNYKPSFENHKKLHIKGSEYVKQKVIKTFQNNVIKEKSEQLSDNSENCKSQTNNKLLETTIEKVFEDNKDSVESNSNNKEVFESISSFDCKFPNCYSNYNDLQQLKQHISDCHSNYQYFNCFECHLCESETQLKKHISECHSQITSETKDLIENKTQVEKLKTSNPTQFSCKFVDCDRVLSSKLKLISHLLKFHSKKRLKCNLCLFETNLISHLKRHRNKEHSKQINRKILNINYFICRVCKETFHSEHVLTKHRNLFHKELALHCNYCEFKAQTNDEFIKHKLIHTNERKLYSCDECSDCFTSQRLLDSHKNYIHIFNSKYLKVLKCHLCEYKTRDQNKWQIHQRRHRGEDPFLCSIDGCDKSFKMDTTLEIHQNRDHYKDNPYKCDKCEEAFPGKYLLTKHKDRDHSERSFVCDLCDYITIEKCRLLRHQLSHSNVKSLKCQINGCEKEFKHKQYLQNHQNRVHFKTLKKNFICDWPECGLSFEARSKLNAHIFRHKKERPITCDWPECEARFADKSALSAHRKTHLKPYKCQSIGCNLRFSSKSEMLKHFKSKHTPK